MIPKVKYFFFGPETVSGLNPTINKKMKNNSWFTQHTFLLIYNLNICRTML